MVSITSFRFTTPPGLCICKTGGNTGLQALGGPGDTEDRRHAGSSGPPSFPGRPPSGKLRRWCPSSRGGGAPPRAQRPRSRASSAQAPAAAEGAAMSRAPARSLRCAPPAPRSGRARLFGGSVSSVPLSCPPAAISGRAALPLPRPGPAGVAAAATLTVSTWVARGCAAVRRGGKGCTPKRAEVIPSEPRPSGIFEKVQVTVPPRPLGPEQ